MPFGPGFFSGGASGGVCRARKSGWKGGTTRGCRAGRSAPGNGRGAGNSPDAPPQLQVHQPPHHQLVAGDDGGAQSAFGGQPPFFDPAADPVEGGKAEPARHAHGPVGVPPPQQLQKAVAHRPHQKQPGQLPQVPFPHAPRSPTQKFPRGYPGTRYTFCAGGAGLFIFQRPKDQENPGRLAHGIMGRASPFSVHPKSASDCPDNGTAILLY